MFVKTNFRSNLSKNSSAVYNLLGVLVNPDLDMMYIYALIAFHFKEYKIEKFFMCHDPIFLVFTQFINFCEKKS